MKIIRRSLSYLSLLMIASTPLTGEESSWQEQAPLQGEVQAISTNQGEAVSQGQDGTSVPQVELSLPQLVAADEPGAVLFTPPEGWQLADMKSLPPSVKVMVIGKGQHDFPPSINLVVEPFSGSLKDYLKIVKEMNESQAGEWKDLGTVRTEAGDASFSQLDFKTQWGDVRMMHVILKKDDNIYILTAAAIKDEFPKYYKDFFNALRSLRFNSVAADNLSR